MPDDYISEIDSTISELLPDDPADVTDGVSDDRREELIELLQYAADELGKSPTLKEFNSLDLDTSGDSVKNAFGTWNEAKETAGLRTWQRGVSVNINEEYFKNIETQEKAYWLGTLFARSSLQKQKKGDGYFLNIGRTTEKAHFVKGFAEAVDSEYPINTYSRQSSKGGDQVQLHISNPYFVANLLEAGYPHPDDDIGGFPSLTEPLDRAFVRGYLESAGYFSSSGWNIPTETIERAETFQQWSESFGSQRPTISDTGPGAATVRVANIFDIRAIFDECWPEQATTVPSWTPYPEKVLDHLTSEHPYPENVPYLEA